MNSGSLLEGKNTDYLEEQDNSNGDMTVRIKCNLQQNKGKTVGLG